MAADEYPPASVSDLVELVYRADWTGLSLTLEVTEFDDLQARSRMAASYLPSWLPESRTSQWPPPPKGPEHEPGQEPDPGDEGTFGTQREWAYRLLIAPGGRFRAEGNRDHFAGSDGQHGDEVLPPADELLLPSWLPARFELELAGLAVVAGRRAHRIIGRPRPVGGGRRSRHRQQRLSAPHREQRTMSLAGIDRIDATLDAELGILLRCEQLHRGQVVRRTEITAITPRSPGAADPADYAAPPADESEADPDSVFSGPGWQRAKTVADAGATALNFMVRHAPHREPPAGSHPGAPPSYPAAGKDTTWPGPPGPDEPVSRSVIRLLYEAGLRRTGFDAELRTWMDPTMDADSFRSAVRNSSMPGVIKLSEAIHERATSWEGRDAISAGLPNMYRIRHIDGGPRRRAVDAEACDGTQRWRLLGNNVAVGNARPLPDFLARLADPAWLLEWRLTGGAEIIEQGRRAYRIRVHPRGPSPVKTAAPALASFGSSPTEVLLDAESGILLRLLLEQAGRPSQQQELTAVTTRPQAAADEFRMEIPPGARVIQESGTVLDEAATSAPAQAALTLTVKGLTAAARVGGFLSSLRESASRDRPEQR